MRWKKNRTFPLIGVTHNYKIPLYSFDSTQSCKDDGYVPFGQQYLQPR